MTTQKDREAPSVTERKTDAGERLPLTAADEAASEVITAWRRYAIRFLRSRWNLPPAAIGITSAVPKEGRTTSSVAFGLSLAHESGCSVAIAGLDFDGYGLAEAFGFRDAPDLEGVLKGDWTLQAALSEAQTPGLSLLPARSSRSSAPVPWPALRRRLPDILAALKREHSYVVCDLPPLAADPDASEIANELDALILITRAGVTPLDRLEDGLSNLPREKLAGVVHIGDRDALPGWVSNLLLE